MVILHTETLKKWGGQQNRVLTEAVGLQNKGHKVLIACHKGSVLAHKAAHGGIKVYELNMVKQAHLVNIPKLMKIIKEENIEIVSTHSSVDSWAGGLAAKFTGRKLIRFRHNLYPIGRGPLAKFIYSLPDRIIAISSAVKDIMTGHGVNKDRISVIHSCVNPEVFNNSAPDIKKTLGLPPGSLIIGNTSTFTEVKGQEFLLKAFNIICKQVPCYLLFAGRMNESSRDKYLQHVEEELRKRVIFLGHREDMPGILQTIDIFVYPSFLEGLGTALLEAMAMERPVAASDIPTFRYFIIDGENGIFFKPKDHESIAEKVLFLIQNSTQRERLGKNARRTILDRFTLNKMIDATEAVYKKVMTGR